MAEIHRSLPEGVGVEVITVVTYEDERPSEMMMAGTSDDSVLHRYLTPRGDIIVKTALLDLLHHGGFGDHVDPGAD